MKTNYVVLGIVWAGFNVFLLSNGANLHGGVDAWRAAEFASVFCGAGVLIYKGFTDRSGQALPRKSR